MGAAFGAGSATCGGSSMAAARETFSMASSKTGFAIIGCGNIAPFHARAIRDLPDARLVAVCTSNPEKGKQVGVEAGVDVAIYNDLGAMLALPEVHVVNICTPSGAHLE